MRRIAIYLIILIILLTQVGIASAVLPSPPVDPKLSVQTNQYMETLYNAVKNAASGAVTSVSATSPISSSGGSTPNISFTGILGTANGGTNSSANANSTSGVVILDASNKLPALDGSQLTNINSNVVQTKNSTILGGAFNTSGNTIPHDNTIPQIGEGIEYTTVSITPTSAANKLRIQAVLNTGSNTAGLSFQTIALFETSIDANNALAVSAKELPTATGITSNINQISQIVLDYTRTAGTTSTLTFRLRIGPNTGNMFVNTDGNNVDYGGTLASSLTVTEYKP